MISGERVVSLVLLALFLAYWMLAYDIELYPGSEAEWINARTFPKAVGASGTALAALLLVLPRQDGAAMTLAALRRLDWVRVGLLAGLMLAYGLLIKSAGFLLATSGFLLGGYLVLGERRPWLLFLASLPVAAGFEFLLAGLLSIHIEDPFLAWIGLAAQ